MATTMLCLTLGLVTIAKGGCIDFATEHWNHLKLCSRSQDCLWSLDFDLLGL